MIGRDAVVEQLADLVARQNLVTLVGAGGVGKTTVAVAVATVLADRFEHGVRFVDFSTLSDPRFVPMAVAKALGAPLLAADIAGGLARWLRGRRLLLVLDGCEHVLPACTQLVGRLRRDATKLAFLATSREPLRAAGELVHRIDPLSAPPPDAPLDAIGALGFPAVALFVDRAVSCCDDFVLLDRDATAMGAICRKLEGIPLAIELTATHIDTFDLPQLSALLDDHLRLLRLQRRGAQRRLGSLAAALDWSHALLQEAERRALRSLSVFPGPFGLDAARHVVDGDHDVVAALAGLVAKSLVQADPAGRTTLYRMLDTTRAYALRKLVDSGEADQARQRHARWQLDALARAELSAHEPRAADWTAERTRLADDVRQALAWASSTRGSPALALALTIAAIPLWMQQSLLAECLAHVRQALAGAAPEAARMQLLAAEGAALLYTDGPHPGVERLWSGALAIAERLQDIPHQMKLLWALPVYLVFAGRYREALRHLRQYRQVARRHGDSADQLSGDRLMATTVQYCGGNAYARRQLERVVASYAAQPQRSHIERFQFDQRGAALGTLANVLWLQGFADRARQTTQKAIADAYAADHPASVFNALGHAAFPVSLHCGDLDAAERHLQAMQDHLAGHPHAIWCQLTDCLRGALRIARGDAGGAAIVAEALARQKASGFLLRRSFYLCMLARGHRLAGRTDRARQAIDEALAWCSETGERWYLPEVLRLKADLLHAEASPNASQQAQDAYRRAIWLSRAQQALAWELRAATSLARAQFDAGDADAARQSLASVLPRLREGFETADCRAAQGLLAQIARAAKSGAPDSRAR